MLSAKAKDPIVDPTTTNHDLFLYFKICYVKKKKKKIRFVSKKDTDQFLFEEKFRFTSNEDANPFLF